MPDDPPLAALKAAMRSIGFEPFEVGFAAGQRLKEEARQRDAEFIAAGTARPEDIQRKNTFIPLVGTESRSLTFAVQQPGGEHGSSRAGRIMAENGDVLGCGPLGDVPALDRVRHEIWEEVRGICERWDAKSSEGRGQWQTGLPGERSDWTWRRYARLCSTTGLPIVPRSHTCSGRGKEARQSSFLYNLQECRDAPSFHYRVAPLDHVSDQLGL